MSLAYIRARYGKPAWRGGWVLLPDGRKGRIERSDGEDLRVHLDGEGGLVSAHFSQVKYLQQERIQHGRRE